MTKYMAAGAFQDLTADEVDLRELGHVAVRPGRLRAGTTATSTACPTTPARASSPTARTCSRRRALKVPTTLAQYTADARKLDAKFGKQGFSPVYIAGEDWYVAMGFVFDYGGNIATRVSGKWKGALNSPKSVAGLTAFKNFFNAASHGSKTTIETQPNPYDVYAHGQRGVDDRADLVHLLRQAVHRRVGAVRDAEPHQGQGHARLPRRLRPGCSGRRRQERSARTGSGTSRAAPPRRRSRRRGTSRTRPRSSTRRRSTSGPRRGAGSSRPRSTGSTSRPGTSCARCWPRS